MSIPRIWGLLCSGRSQSVRDGCGSHCDLRLPTETETTVMNLEDHPTVRRLSKHIAGGTNQQPGDAVLDAAWLRRLALDLAGLVEIARPALGPQRDEIHDKR